MVPVRCCTRYVQRLSDDGPFLDLTIEVQQFYLSKNQLKAAARMAFRILEHVYFKHDSLLNEERRRCPAPLIASSCVLVDCNSAPPH